MNIIAVILQAIRGMGGPPRNDLQESVSAQTAPKEATLVGVGRQLDKVKKIRVSQTGLPYLADMISRIEKGDAQANWMLGACFLRGNLSLIDPFPRDMKSALFWFRRSAELGLASSQYHLGVMYLGDTARQLRIEYSENDALEKRFDEALKWLNEAANQSGNFASLAQDVLGEIYFLGIGVNQDHAKAFYLFSKSEANPTNMSRNFGLPTRASERLPILKAEGHT